MKHKPGMRRIQNAMWNTVICAPLTYVYTVCNNKIPITLQPASNQLYVGTKDYGWSV